MMSAIAQFKSPDYRQTVQKQMEEERERKKLLTNQAAKLEKQVQLLVDESVALLKTRLAELGIQAKTPADIFDKAKELIQRHKELESQSASIQQHVIYLALDTKVF